MKYRYKCDKIDIDNGVKFRYYIITGKYLKVNNQYPCSIYCDKVGTEIDLILDNTTPNKDLIIKLSYNGVKYNYIRVKQEDIPTTRLTLVATQFNEKYGTTWYLKNYNGNITLE